METYPIMIDEELAGKLTVEKQGGRTVFDAECRMLPGIVRLSVYGGGKEGYLGVLAPEDGKLRLHKALSRGDMRDFPAEIDAAERSGLNRPAAEQDVGTAHGAAPEEPEESGGAEAKTPGAPDVPEGAEDAGDAEDGEGLDWYSSPDGALVCFDGTQTLIALPAGDERIPAEISGRRRTVEGREYFVYRTKDGRIVE